MSAFVSMTVILICVVSLAFSQVGNPSTRPSGELAPGQGQSALARIDGRTLNIYPTGIQAQTRDLDFEYLWAASGSDGRSLVGWGFPRSRSLPPSRAVAVISVTFDYGRNSQIVEGFKDPTALSVSPDSRRLALIATNVVRHFRGLQIVEIRGSRPAEDALQVEGQAADLDSYVAWSSDSQRILFATNNRIQLLDVTSSERCTVALGKYPSWSPDGRFLAFYAADSRLSILNLATTRSVHVPGAQAINGRVAWAPDSRRFAVEQAWHRKDRNRNCPTNSRIIEYSFPGLATTILLDPCGVKPERFFWLQNWNVWLPAQ